MDSITDVAHVLVQPSESAKPTSVIRKRGKSRGVFSPFTVLALSLSLLLFLSFLSASVLLNTRSADQPRRSLNQTGVSFARLRSPLPRRGGESIVSLIGSLFIGSRASLSDAKLRMLAYYEFERAAASLPFPRFLSFILNSEPEAMRDPDKCGDVEHQANVPGCSSVSGRGYETVADTNDGGYRDTRKPRMLSDAASD